MAADTIIRSYRETKRLVEEESKGYNESLNKEEAEMTPEAARMDARSPVFAPIVQHVREVGGEPFRVSFGAKGMEITGHIQTAKDADELIRAVEALKVLLKAAPPTGGIDPDEYHPEDRDARD